MPQNKKVIKGYAVICSLGRKYMPIKAFEDLEKVELELERIDKVTKDSGENCTHKIIPCEIKIKIMTQNNKDWEKELLNRIKFASNFDYGLETAMNNDSNPDEIVIDYVKSLLTSSHESWKKEVTEEIEERKVNEDMRITYIDQSNFSVLKGRKGYNQALQEVLEILK